jgi:hypothetical protein
MKHLMSGAFIVIAGCMPYSGYHPYLITNDNCRCEQYHVKDAEGRVRYTVSAVYEVDEAVATIVTINVENMSPDTVDFSLAYVRISSRNIPYRYNDKSVPLAVSPVAPGRSMPIRLRGEGVQGSGKDPWLGIAGEELVVTLKGIRAGRRELREQVFRLVPMNPRLGV